MATVKGIQKDPLIPGSKANRALFPSKANKPLTPKAAKALAKTNTQYNQVTKRSHTPLLGVKPTTTSGFGASAIGSLWHEIKLTGQEAAALPKNTLEGIGTIGKATVHDALHGPSLGEIISNPSRAAKQSDLATVGKQMWDTDPIVNSVKHLSLKPIENNPLGTVMDATMVGAPALKAADAASAIGGVGEDASLADRAAAGLAAFRHGSVREPAYLPETNFRQVGEHYSQNPLVRVGQKWADHDPNRRTVKIAQAIRHPGMKLKTGEATNKISALVRQAADENHAYAEAKTTSDLADLAHTIKSTQPKEELRDLTGHLATGAPADHSALVAHLEQRLKRLDENHHLVTTHPDHLDDEAAKQIGLNAAALRSHIAILKQHPEFGETLVTHNKALADITNALDEEKRLRGLNAPTLRSLLPHAQEYMGAVHSDTLDRPIPTERALVARGAKEDYADAQKDLQRIQARKNLPPEEKAVQMKAAREEVAAKREAFKAAGSPLEKVNGWVRPVAGGYKPLTEEDIRSDMAVRGIDPDSARYMHMGGPEDDVLGPTHNPGAGASTTRGGTPGPKYRGSSFEAGSFQPGQAHDVASIRRSILALGRAREWDAGVRRVGILDEDGKPFDLGTTAGRNKMSRAADEYEARYGVPLERAFLHPKATSAEDATTIADRQGVTPTTTFDPAQDNRGVLMPKPYMDRLRQFDDLRNQQGNILSGATRLFRSSVLPFSANYWQSIVQEGLFRGAMSGKLFNTTRKFNETLKALDEKSKDLSLPADERLSYKDAHDQLKVMGGAGTTMGQQDRDLVHSMNTPAGHKALRKFEATLTAPGQWALKKAHKLESAQTKMVLSSTLKGFQKSSGSMRTLVDALAKGEDGANLMAKAQHDINDVLGRYLVRSPQEQKWIRNYAPFWSWLSNANRFVYVTMTKDHPFVNAFAHQVGVANAQAWAQQHPNTQSMMTGFLGTEFGTPGETIAGRDLFRNTPYGIGEETPAQYASTVMPVETSAIYGLAGLTPFGDKLPGQSGAYGSTMQAGSWGATKNMVEQVGADLVPYYGVGKKIVQAADNHASHTAQLGIAGNTSTPARVLANTLGASLIAHKYAANKSSSSSSSSGVGGLSSSGSGIGGLGGSGSSGVGGL